MKHKLLIMALLAIVSLVACSMEVRTLTQTTASNTPADPAAIHTISTTTSEDTAQEAEIRALVEGFGKKLQVVALQSPGAAQELQKQYSEFVSAPLLKIWMNDISKAPGRMVSSPWPDRIEITTLSSAGSDMYAITGFVVEITSTEIASGGAAAKIPVRILAQRAQEGWLITEYVEER